jgi:hypothetical protein
MFFNGFTLMLCIISFGIGMWTGIRAEQAHQEQLRDRWLNGETIEDQMERDGWSL